MPSGTGCSPRRAAPARGPPPCGTVSAPDQARSGDRNGTERHGTGDRDMGGPVVLLIGGVWLLLCGVLVVGGLAAVVRGLRRRTAARRLLGAGVATRGVIVDNQLTSLSEGQV